MVILMDGVKGYSTFAAIITDVSIKRGSVYLVMVDILPETVTLSKILSAKCIVSIL